MEKFKYFIKIFGCQMNYTDADRVSAIFQDNNIQPTSDLENADFIVAISCGVRQSAEERLVSWMKKARKIKKDSIIILTGCLSERRDLEKRLKNAVDYFIRISDIGQWSEVIDSECISETTSCSDEMCFECQMDCSSLQNHEDDFKKNIKDFYEVLPRYSSEHRAYIPIMTGCNNFCSYCVVPYARGPEVSREPESIIDEIKSLISKGYKEIFLLGQNVNSYQGKGKSNNIWNFSKLLNSINKINGDFWIKFTSSHPKDISDEFLQTLKSCEKISPNLHLPMQSGSTKILEAMNRKYTKENYLKLVDKIYSKIPNVVLSTDVIVGFPGETDDDFEDTLDVVRKAKFEMLFALKYSPRPGTAAFKIKNDVSIQEKIDRFRKLDKIWKVNAEEANKKYLGKIAKVLIDTVKNKKGVKALHGRTFEDKNIEVIFDGEGDYVGKWVTAKVVETGPLGLKGELNQSVTSN